MEKTMQIEGMMCQHCVAHVEKALLGVPGVAAVQVDLAQKQAKVTADVQVEASTLQKAVEEAGYQVISVK